MVECRTPEREVRGSRPTSAVLCPWARHFTPRKYWLITQEAMAPSRHDWKIVDRDVKPQHNQPLFKKGDRSLACYYCPVSLTCVPCKLLEHIVCSNIMAHLDEYKLLSDRQHAFRKGHSCETQLTTVLNDWVKIPDNRGQVYTFILDFEKAFDTPPHELL